MLIFQASYDNIGHR